MRKFWRSLQLAAKLEDGMLEPADLIKILERAANDFDARARIAFDASQDEGVLLSHAAYEADSAALELRKWQTRYENHVSGVHA